jgi:hypothetical protein
VTRDAEAAVRRMTAAALRAPALTANPSARGELVTKAG